MEKEFEGFSGRDFLGEGEEGLEEDWGGEFGGDEGSGGGAAFTRRERVGRNGHWRREESE